MSAEPLVTRWLATLSETEIELYEYVVELAHAIIAECYSSAVIVPGVTTAGISPRAVAVNGPL